MPEAPHDPNLKPAGAGLPAVELLFSKTGFAFYRWKTSDLTVTEHFRSQGSEILALAMLLPPNEGHRRTIIDRVMGIEDHSRDWSVYMTLDHLRQVNDRIRGIVMGLCDGRSDPPAADVTQVIPNEKAGPDVIDLFSDSVNAYVKQAGARKELPKTEKHPHPWFGALDAHGWHCVAAVHMAIHHRQIESILHAQRAEAA